MTQELVNNLLVILENEYENYCKLNELALAKRDVLVTNDVEGLAGILSKDNKIVDELEALEDKRVKLVNQLATIYNLEPDKINFSDLARALPEKWKPRLTTLKERLLTMIDELHLQNEQNKLLLEEAVRLNNFSINMIMRAIEPDNHTYNPTKGKTPKNNKTTHIVDRRG